jgi:lysophospholipase L1-like esterase
MLLLPWAIVAAGVCTLPAPAAAAPPRLGIMGDSLSAGNGSSWGENPNWHTQLTLANRASVVRNTAFGGAETNSLASQRASIIPFVQTAQIDFSVLIIGGNDAVFHYGFGIANGGDPNPFITAVTTNIRDTLDAIAAAGSAHQIVANIPDASRSPVVREQAALFGITEAQLNLAVDAIETANEQIKTLAFSRGIPVLDLFRFSQDVVDHPPLELAGVSFADLFAPDRFHPAPIIQGLLANMVVEAANGAFGADIGPLTDQELVLRVGRTPLTTDPTFYDVRPYVLVVPEPSTLLLASLAMMPLLVRAVRRRRRDSESRKSFATTA